MTVTNATRSAKPTTFADILDKGLVVDAFVRLSLVGIEVLTIDARIVLASVDTYLKFAEAVNRLDLSAGEQPQGLPQFIGSIEQRGAAAKTRGAFRGLREKASDIVDKVRPGKDKHEDGGESEHDESKKD